MPSGTAPTCACIGSYPPNEVQQWIYCALLTLTAAVQAGGGGGGGPTQYESYVSLETNNGFIPAGVLSWSITAISGTVEVMGGPVAVGASVSGGGYGSATLSAQVDYTVTGGSVLISYDTPV